MGSGLWTAENYRRDARGEHGPIAEPPGFDAETYLSASLGGGMDLRADKRLGVRLQGRAFATLLDHDGELFCRADGVANICALAIESTVLVQWEARAGTVFRF